MYVNVALPVPLMQTFTYAVPSSLAQQAQPGTRALVPFRHRERIGLIMEQTETPPNITGRVKTLSELCDKSPLCDDIMLELLQWISRYYMAPIGEVCRAALPSAFFRRAALARKSRIGLAHMTDVETLDSVPIVFTAAQQQAIDHSQRLLGECLFHTTLLHGVTGSGKTEVYLATMEAAIKQGRQALFMLPEIGLTPQLLARVTAHFPDRVALYHSGLTEAQRVEQWLRLHTGAADICCGTRSAIFAPLHNLGCIIVDEEHDGAYKQEESPRYHARDVAVVRAKLSGALALLGSATPSLETYHNVERKKYHYLSLPDRPTGGPLPEVMLVDMRKEPTSNDASGLFSRPLLQALDANLQAGEQTILFLNRRGFSQLLLCRDCGAIFRCPDCDIALTLHRRVAELRCHYCEFSIPRPTTCRECGATHLKAMGSGTERIEDALLEHFPQVSIARFDRDTTTARGARQQLLRDMHSGKTEILIGTQMITKGHDFPGVTLVGIMQADLSLYLPDFRASERTFQLLTQVAGRAGRRNKPGRVIVQTFTPEHYSLLAAQSHNYMTFVAKEETHRRELGYPPYGKLINVRCTSNSESKAASFAQGLRDALSRVTVGGTLDVSIVGPAPAPRAKLAGRHRWQLLLKMKNAADMRKVSEAIATHTTNQTESGVQVAVDVDPLHLL
jgi:primosomal protein N' (replication factor Y) (superfamily II helicase)